MKLSMIAAIGKNNELGKNNDLIWHLPNDLQFFKTVTNGKTIVMGQNTFFSLPKMLPNRKHIVLTFTDEIYPKEVDVFKSIEDFFNQYKNYDDDIFIIGGASIYRQFIDLVDTIYLTEIDEEDSNADVYFPVFNKQHFIQELIGENQDHGISYQHMKYIRKG